MNCYLDALAQETDSLELRAKILGNRALINMWLKNYGKVLEDCLHALSITPKNIKLYVRASEAFLSLEKFDKCIQMAQRGLEIDTKQKDLTDMLEEAKKGKNKLENSQEYKQKLESKKLMQLIELCQKKGIALGKASEFPLPPIYNVEFFLILEIYENCG